MLIDFTNPNVRYIGTARQGGCIFGDILLYKSTDGGATWSDLEPDNSCKEGGTMAMDPADTNVLYLATFGLGVFRSTDGGAPWAPINNGLTHFGVTSLTIVGHPVAAGQVHQVQSRTRARQAVFSSSNSSAGNTQSESM